MTFCRISGLAVVVYTLLMGRTTTTTHAFTTPVSRRPSRIIVLPKNALGATNNNDAASSSAAAGEKSPNAAPVLNGKRVLPFKVIKAGLKGHRVAAVFALMNKDYKRGYAGWEQCEHIGVTKDLDATLEELLSKEDKDQMAHVRAMSFVVPSEGAMESIADDWRKEAVEGGGKINFDPVMAAMQLPFDDDDDDDDDDDFDSMEMTAQAMSMARTGGTEVTAGGENSDDEDVVSPFDVSSLPKAATTTTEKLAFTRENVDKVLDEVRPYLISDGGNVSVEDVVEESRSVILKLEGACGSCPSSTVTMQMGIERVLKENFENLGEVVRIEDVADQPTELTMEVVAAEVNRIKPAIIAMGGSVEIISVDPEGLVEIKFKGANKVRQGLELAIQDIDFVREVRFLEDE